MIGLVFLSSLSRPDRTGAISAMSRISGMGTLPVISGLEEGFPNMLICQG